jgi:hypothetical protein
VTGGGLPAEIWREVMLRVHDGVPERPLPMVQPAPAQVVFQGDVNEVVPLEQQAPTRQPDRPTNIIDQVLQDIFGGGGGGGRSGEPTGSNR